MHWKDEKEHLIDAMVIAEGGPSAFVRAVRCSIPTCTDYQDAREIASNTIFHALWDYTTKQDPDGGLSSFVRFLGSRWAPIGASNDPTHLNENWVPNVLTALYRSVSTATH